MKFTSSTKSILFLPLLSLVGCGISSEKKDHGTGSSEPITVGDSIPADSSGAYGDVSFGLSASASLGLEGDAVAESVKIGNHIVLSYAKFSIAKIKIKANKIKSKEEEAQDEQEVANEQEDVKDLEDMIDDSSQPDLAMVRDSEKSDKRNEHAALSEERKAKIKEHHDTLAAKEDKRIDEESRHDHATRFKGPFVFNAISGELEGDMENVKLADGSYSRVEFQLKRNFKVDEAEPLYSNVFVIKGKYLQGDTAIPFEIEWHIALNFRLVGDGVFQVKSGDDNELLISLDMDKWFDGIDFTKANVDADGTVYISKASNRDLMRQLHRNIKTTSGFGKDGNHDGKLQDAEKAGSGEETEDASSELSP